MRSASGFWSYVTELFAWVEWDSWDHSWALSSGHLRPFTATAPVLSHNTDKTIAISYMLVFPC